MRLRPAPDPGRDQVSLPRPSLLGPSPKAGCFGAAGLSGGRRVPPSGVLCVNPARGYLP